jgi:hypothetical protein
MAFHSPSDLDCDEISGSYAQAMHNYSQPMLDARHSTAFGRCKFERYKCFFAQNGLPRSDQEGFLRFHRVGFWPRWNYNSYSIIVTC